MLRKARSEAYFATPPFNSLAGKIVCVLSAVLGPYACTAPPAERLTERYEFIEQKMGTAFRLVLYASTEEQAAAAARRAFARVDEINEVLSDYLVDSEWSRLSQASQRSVPTPVIPVSEDSWKVFRAAQDYAIRSSGAFDITVGPFVRLWRRAVRQKEIPSPERLQQAAQSVGFAHLELFPEQQAVRLHAPDMRLDAGAIGKGYAADQVLELLEDLGVPRALVDAGGDIAVSAPPPGRSGWRVELDLRDSGVQSAPVLLLAHQAVATSGDRYRFVEIAGVRYSHIVDPRTGIGVTGRTAAAVVAPTGMAADALASVLCVLPYPDNLLWIENQADAEAYLSLWRNGDFFACQSSGFADILSP